jgi:hypothetical protein
MIRRLLIVPILLTLAFAVSAVADVIQADYPRAQHRSGYIVVSWATNDESSVKEFRVLRRSGTEGDFAVVGAAITAKGVSSLYEYEDKEAFKSTVGIYQYRIRVVFTNGSFEDSAIKTVSSPANAARRTWGSIKAMFR